MSTSLYRKIMDEVAGIQQVDSICITGLGEPTLDPKLVWRVEYARKSKPNAFIDLFTNGVYMKPSLFDAVRDAGVSCVNFSLNAVRQEQHEEIMGLKDKFDTVCMNIDYAIANRGKAKIEVRAVPVKGSFTIGDAEEFYKRWGFREAGGHGALITEGNWAGDNRTVRQFNPSDACFRALGQIYVTYDGKVTPCCFMPDGNVVSFGDLNTQTIKEVYNSPQYLRFREDHAANQADRHSFCAKCSRI